jgi:hypothetical protein
MLSFPVTGISASRFVIKPKVSAGWRLDTNYYKNENNETEVHTYLVQPGIEFGYETAKSLIVLDYTLDAHYYDYQDSGPPGAETDDFVGHTLSLKTQTRPSARFTVGLEESFYQTRDPFHTDVLSNYEVREEYYINRLTPRVIYEFGPRFSAGFRYRWTEVDYDRSVEEDSAEHRGIFDLKYNLTPRSSLDLQYQHWEMDYDVNTSDYTSDQIGLVFGRRFKYFSFEVGGGYHERSFDDSGLEDIDTFAYHVGVKGKKARSHIALRAEQNFDNYHEAGDYHKAKRVELEVGHLFMGKLPATIEGVYQNSDYEGVTTSGDRDDDTYGISASLGYLFTDWLTFTMTAGYEERDSNLAGLDYENEYFLIQLDFTYDVGRR